jgi:hypothetical protein
VPSKDCATIEIKILDYWMEDTYTLKGYKVYCLVNICGRLELLERYIGEII